VGSLVGIAVNYLSGKFLDAHPSTLGFATFVGAGALLSWLDTLLWNWFPDRFNPAEKRKSGPSELLGILRTDRNFFRYVRVLAIYNFLQGIASPIYIPYMIKTLKMSFTTFCYFGILASIAGAFSNIIW
jgi:hypothetical protein